MRGTRRKEKKTKNEKEKKKKCQVNESKMSPLLQVWLLTFILLRATAVTQGRNRYQNKSQYTKLTLKKKILPLLLSGLKPVTFQSWVQRSYHSANPAPLLTTSSCKTTESSRGVPRAVILTRGRSAPAVDGKTSYRSMKLAALVWGLTLNREMGLAVATWTMSCLFWPGLRSPAETQKWTENSRLSLLLLNTSWETCHIKKKKRKQIQLTKFSMCTHPHGCALKQWHTCVCTQRMCMNTHTYIHMHTSHQTHTYTYKHTH